MGRWWLLTLLLLWPTWAHAERLEPASTWVVAAGVLEWEDPGLASFSKVNRKDRELFETLAKMGVPLRQATLLLDAEATAAAVEAALADVAKRAPADATLIFYFAGHGVKEPQGEIIFTTADTRVADLAQTGLHLSRLQPMLDRFKGRRMILLADSCHSGGLVAVAQSLSRRRGVVALTSAEASNISTANWTFTQTVIDGLRGRGIHDRDGDGVVELFEVADEVRDAMRHREGQRYGYGNHGVPEGLAFAKAKPEAGTGSAAVARGAWVRAPRDGRTQIGRVLTVKRDRAQVEFYDYSTYDLKWVAAGALQPVVERTWPVGAEIDVTWLGQVYLAKVLAVEDGFMRITYPGYSESWDEWIPAARVVGEAGAKPSSGQSAVKVEWHGRWYDAVLRSRDGERFCISYVGYDASWDECVEKQRIRF